MKKLNKKLIAPSKYKRILCYLGIHTYSSLFCNDETSCFLCGKIKNCIDFGTIDFVQSQKNLDKVIKEVEQRKVEEIRGEIKENKLNYSINSNQHRQDIGFGYNKAINDTLNLKSLKIKE